MKPEQNKRETTQFTMRIENGLYELVKASALRNKRSTVREIEFALELYIKEQK